MTSVASCVVFGSFLAKLSARKWTLFLLLGIVFHYFLVLLHRSVMTTLVIVWYRTMSDHCCACNHAHCYCLPWHHKLGCRPAHGGHHDLVLSFTSITRHHKVEAQQVSQVHCCFHKFLENKHISAIKWKDLKMLLSRGVTIVKIWHSPQQSHKLQLLLPMLGKT